MIKLIGTAAVIASCAAVGMRKSSELRRRCRELSLLEQSLFDIGIALEYSAATTAEIVSMLQRSGRLGFFSQLEPADLYGSLMNSDGFRSLAITRPEKEIVADVFSQLGATDLATQLAMIEFNKKRLNAAIDECELECSRKCRLYNSLGFLGGIFISLMII